MRTIEILKKARELLSKPDKWTQYCQAKDRLGYSCSPKSPKAACFCAVGAVRRFEPENITNKQQRRILSLLDEATPNGCIIRFNDSAASSAVQVVAVFEKAIQAAGG